MYFRRNSSLNSFMLCSLCSLLMVGQGMFDVLCFTNYSSDEGNKKTVCKVKCSGDLRVSGGSVRCCIGVLRGACRDKVCVVLVRLFAVAGISMISGWKGVLFVLVRKWLTIVQGLFFRCRREEGCRWIVVCQFVCYKVPNRV